MKRVAVLTPDEAASWIRDGDTITVMASSGVAEPEAVLRGIGERFRATGRPRGLTVVFPIAVGDTHGLLGLDHLAEPGLVRRLIGGSFAIGRRDDGSRPRITELIEADAVEAYNLPQGVLMHLMREIAAHRPGVITRVGLGSFVDPRHGGGRMNAATREDIVQRIDLMGEEWLFFPGFPLQLAVLRGTSADELGNVSMEHEGAVLGALAQATAVHNHGGRVIVQVKRLVRAGSLDPHRVRLPATVVDAVVLDPDQTQATRVAYEPALSGETRAAGDLGRLRWPVRACERIIGRRALAEAPAGATVSLGFGVPGAIPTLVHEGEGPGELTFVIEQGAVGGEPLGGPRFGVSMNPEAIVDSPAHFDFLDGGGFDIAFLAFAEADAQGNVNVHRLPGSFPGAGGFLDIVSRAPVIVFCGTFTTGGLEVAVEGGQLRILREGSIVKFRRELVHRTFAAAYRRARRVMYVTERAVLELGDSGLELVEVAPGVDIERDVLARMEFRPRVRAAVRPMRL